MLLLFLEHKLILDTVKFVLLSICRYIHALYICFELTPLYPDGVECTHLAYLASHALQFYELVHFPVRLEA